MTVFVPSLGSYIRVGAGCTSVRFLAFPSGDPSRHLEVWTNLDGEWHEHVFEPCKGSSEMLSVNIAVAQPSGEYEYTFRSLTDEGEVHWLSVFAGIDNGRISKSTAKEDSSFSESKYPLIDYDRANIQSDSGDSVQVLSFPLPAGEVGSIASFNLGRPADSATKGLIVERTKPWWFTHRQLHSTTELSSELDVQLLILGSEDQVHVFFPISTSTSCATIRGSMDDSGHIWLRSERDSTQAGEAICVMTSGPQNDLLEIIGSCIEAAKLVLKRSSKTMEEKPETELAESSWTLHESKKAIYCTWNSLGGDYTLSKVLDRLQGLQDAGALDMFDSVLLDDGWQDRTVDKTLNSFSAKPGWMDVEMENGTEKYTEEELANRDFRRKDSGVQLSGDQSSDSIDASADSLRTAVITIKGRFPQIKSVGVWLTTQGYWDGIQSDGNLSKQYDLQKFHRPPLSQQYQSTHVERDVYLPSLADLDSFWNGYFSVLKTAGVTYVKVDNQADADDLVGEDAGEMRWALGRFMRAAANKTFGPGNLINCMPGGPREYNEVISERADTRWSMRTSDDFFPEYPETHRLHIANNASTAFLDRFLSITRDFDMFITYHERALYHALLRTFSNAPIYITDTEQPNMEVLNALGGKDRQGEYRIVKATNGKSVRLSNTVFETVTGDGEGAALKVALPVDEVKGAIIGAWNCRADKAKTADGLTTRDVSDALQTLDKESDIVEWAVIKSGKEARYTTLSSSDLKEARTVSPLSSQPIFPIRLEGETSTTFTIAPMMGFETGTIVPLGHVDKFVGLCAIRSVTEGVIGKAVKQASTPRAGSETVRSAAVRQDAADQATTTSAQSPVIQKMAIQAEAPSETTPLLAKSTQPNTQSASTLRSRLFTLLLFWRSDLNSLRRSLFRDFAVSPFATLYREIRAIFGGPATMPTSAESSADRPVMAERSAPVKTAVQATEPSPATEATAQPVEQDEEVDNSTEDRVVMEPVGEGIIIETIVAGQLGFLMLSGELSDYTFTLEGHKVDKYVTKEDRKVVLDMVAASKELDLGEGETDATSFYVGVLRKA